MRDGTGRREEFVDWRKGARQGLAIAALAAPLGLAACSPGYWPWNRPLRADRQAIERRYAQWVAARRENRHSDAYQLMSPAYRTGHSLAEFAEGPWPDPVAWALEPGYSLWKRGSKACLYPFDDGWLEFWNGPELEWIKLDGEWFLTGKVTWYTD